MDHRAGPGWTVFTFSFLLVHGVHGALNYCPGPPLASPRGGAPAGGERPFSSHDGSSAAFLGSTENFSARPCRARWSCDWDRTRHDSALERGSTIKVNASSSLTWLSSSILLCAARPLPRRIDSPPSLASTGQARQERNLAMVSSSHGGHAPQRVAPPAFLGPRCAVRSVVGVAGVRACV